MTSVEAKLDLDNKVCCYALFVSYKIHSQMMFVWDY